jgi:hypothetical protein
MANVKLRIDTFQAAAPDEVETSREIDHGYKNDRAWLDKHLFWAVRNGRGVEITPLVTAE